MLEIYNHGVSKAKYGDEPWIYADNKHKTEFYTEDQKTISIQQQQKNHYGHFSNIENK